MRIAFFTECYTPVINGVVTSLLTLREALIDLGHEVHVIAPGPALPDDDHAIHRLPALPFPRHPYRFARPFPHLESSFDRLNLDIIHCHHPFTIGRLGAETARKLHLPMVYTAHSLYDNMVEHARSQLMRTMGRRAVRGVVRRFCARADYVIVPSQHTRNALIQAGVEAPFAVVPSGIKPRPISETGRSQIRHRYELTDKTLLLIYVGRIAPEKRIDLLLNAVAEMVKRRPEWDNTRFRLILVGDGQSRNEMETLAGELNLCPFVQFAGSQPFSTIGDWYAAGDLFVMPSPSETQGIVLLEAMNAGLPCVAVSEGGPVELIDSGDTGMLSPFDVDAYTEAILSLMEDDATRHRIGENGRQVALRHTPEAMVKEVLQVYESVSGINRMELLR